jgi:hypothetical protein
MGAGEMTSALLHNTGLQNYYMATVTYTGGYETIPADIAKATAMQLIYEYKRLPDIGANNISGEGGSISYPELGLMDEVKRLLSPYIHPAKHAW